MIKLYLSCVTILVCLPIIALSQNKIDGIGQFRVGKTVTSVLERIAADKNVKINQESTSMDRYLAEGAIYKITKNICLLSAPKEDEIEDPKYKHSTDVKVYFIDYLEISGVPFAKLYLSFYNDTLYSIHAEGSNEITDAMKVKYGEPILKVTKKKVKCTSRISGNFEVEELAYDSQWESGIPSIKVTSYTSAYYNSKCEKNYFSFFSIENQAIEKKLSNQEEKYLKDKELTQKAEKKKPLSNF